MGMQSLVLDLRQNPGGILGESVRVAQHLVSKGPIVSVIDREGRKYTEESYLEKIKYPLAVLVDHGSASASEIVAGAVQDSGAGKLFGTQTFRQRFCTDCLQITSEYWAETYYG